MKLRNFMSSLENMPFSEPLTEEETLLLSVDAAQDLVEIEQDFNQIRRVEDLVDGLEDLGRIAAGIESAQYSDLLLVETAARLAVAGSDLTLNEITPGLEQYHNAKISTESIQELAQALWEGVKGALDRVWKKINDFFTRMLTTIPRTRKAVERLRERAQSKADGKVKENKTALGPEVNALALAHKAPANEKDILTALTELKRQNNAFFGKHLETVVKVGGALAGAIEKFDPAKPEGSLERINNAALALDLATSSALSKATKVEDRRFEPSATVMASAPLPGNRSVFFTQNLSEGDSVLGKAEALRYRQAIVKPTLERPKAELSEGTITTLQSSDILDICDLCDQLLDQLERYRKSECVTAIEKTKGELAKACEKATKAVDAFEGSNVTPKIYLRSTINYNSSYLRWASQPQTSLMSLTLAACRAAVTIANKSLSNIE